MGTVIRKAGPSRLRGRRRRQDCDAGAGSEPWVRHTSVPEASGWSQFLTSLHFNFYLQSSDSAGQILHFNEGEDLSEKARSSLQPQLGGHQRGFRLDMFFPNICQLS